VDDAHLSFLRGKKKEGGGGGGDVQTSGRLRDERGAFSRLWLKKGYCLAFWGKEEGGGPIIDASNRGG